MGHDVLEFDHWSCCGVAKEMPTNVNDMIFWLRTMYHCLYCFLIFLRIIKKITNDIFYVLVTEAQSENCTQIIFDHRALPLTKHLV